MNPLENSATSNGSGGMVKYAFWMAALLALIVAGLTSGVNGVEQLLLGWIYFPFRVIPRMTVDWPSVIAGSAAIIAFLYCLHLTLRWLMGQGSSLSVEAIRYGTVRTTTAIAIFLMLLFAAGTALVGAVHQVVWLMTGRASRTAESQAEPRVLGAVAQALTAARRSQQRINMKQVGLAMHNFHDTFSEFPPGGTVDDRGRLMHGWAIFIGAFAGYSAEGIDFGKPWNAPPNDRLYRCALNEYINPSIPEIFDKDGFGLSHVAGNVNVLAMTRVPHIDGDASWYQRKELDAARSRDDSTRRNLPLRITDITDGTANTLLIGEAAGNFKPWGHPANLRDPAFGVGQSPDGFGGPLGHGGAQFVMCDGSVRFISNRVDRTVLTALGTPAGGEQIDLKAIDGQSP